MNWITVAIYCMPASRISLKSFDPPIRIGFTWKRPPSFYSLIGNRTSIHKALITREGISAISSEKVLNSSNIAVFRTFIGADNPWNTSNLFYTVTIVPRYSAGVIVSDTGFKPQNTATVSIYCAINTKNWMVLAYQIQLYARCNLVLWHSTSDVSDAG